jgi:hypothetical protein
MPFNFFPSNGDAQADAVPMVGLPRTSLLQQKMRRHGRRRSSADELREEVAGCGGACVPGALMPSPAEELPSDLAKNGEARQDAGRSSGPTRTVQKHQNRPTFGPSGRPVGAASSPNTITPPQRPARTDEPRVGGANGPNPPQESQAQAAAKPPRAAANSVQSPVTPPARFDASTSAEMPSMSSSEPALAVRQPPRAPNPKRPAILSEAEAGAQAVEAAKQARNALKDQRRVDLETKRRELYAWNALLREQFEADRRSHSGAVLDGV